MRRELILVFLAISTMIVAAFVIPLGLSAQATARDRALDRARSVSAALTPLVATGDRAAIDDELAVVNAQEGPRLTVTLIDGSELGASVVDRRRLDAVPVEATSLSGSTDGGHELVTAVVLPDGVAAIRSFVPDAELERGVLAAWATLAGLGAALILGSVALADRIAQRIIAPAIELAGAAEDLGAGDFTVHVEPSGPPELATTAAAFNVLVDRVRKMVDDERAMVAELTHRLRTPLTRLRVGLDQVADPRVADQLHDDVNALTAEVNDLISRARHNVEPPESIDVAAVVAERVEFWAVLAVEEDRDCRLERNDRFDLRVEADELGAAVDVLIENIFAHTRPGTALAVSTTALDDGGGAIVIEDGGPGFDPAYAAPGQSSGGSTGLGLAIVARLVDRCRGTMTIGTSALGGARVECRFPGTAREA